MSASREWSASTGHYTGKGRGKSNDGRKNASGSLHKVDQKQKMFDAYDVAIMDYNAAYTDMSDAGMALLRERERSVDLIKLAEHLVNSVANTPKEYKADFDAINTERKTFVSSEEFARKELNAARQSTIGAGTGVAAGTAVVSLAPTAAMWIATTFGTASTGTAISTLSGAAATNAALAWLGGGALSAGGAGMAGGSALLALAGPIGWTIAGASVLTSIVLLTKKKRGIAKEKTEELEAIKRNTEALREAAASICDILDRTSVLREALSSRYMLSVRLFDEDYLSLDSDERLVLGSVVNGALALAQLLNQKVNVGQDTRGN